MPLSSYKRRRVLITGHTGFKGSWLCKILSDAGAIISGYSLEAPTEPNLYSLAKIDDIVEGNMGDIRNFTHFETVFREFEPEIVFHLAAQPIVKGGYNDPKYTYETNVMGTVNVLECVRNSSFVKSFVNVTTDKVYLNKEWVWGYRESDVLNGHDPYSNSKSCSELITETYNRSFLQGKVAISTVRAGNVIGGGDFAPHRIIPDCVRSVINRESLEIRNPHSIRPYQHVLESLSAYLLIAEKQMDNLELCGSYNVGPDEGDCITTEELVNTFGKNWEGDFKYVVKKEENPQHEASYLKLDCSKIKSRFNWTPAWSIKDAVKQVCNWTKIWLNGGNVGKEMSREINLYYEGFK